MEESTITLGIDLHYFMDDEQRHEMDASIHNKCEASMIQVLNHLGDLFGEDIQIDVSALGEGGLIDKFKIVFKSEAFKNLFMLLAGALINHFICVSPSLDESEKQLNRAELLKKIKEGDFTEEDILFLVKGDPDILTNRNKYYSELVKEPHVTSVSCSSYNRRTPNVKLSEASISKSDFSRQIIKGSTNSVTSNYSNTSVLVVSPVLLKSSQAKWKGIFNGEEINFKIVDKEFLKQVYAKEIGFTTGTILNCDLKVTSKTEYDAYGKPTKSTYEREISNILSWDDGNQILHKTKKYKRLKAEMSMPSLFKDSDFE